MRYLPLILLIGCSEALPEIGSALNQVRDTAVEVKSAYDQAREVKASLESVYTQVCIPPLVPGLLGPCDEIRKALDQVDDAEEKSFEALSAAFEGINAAIEVYNEVNR